MVPLEGAIRLLNYLPTADLVVLNRCGHWPTVERPADYTRCALQFL
jgi:2-hydroxy-6-oxonona-2,4-dienedioate hydrolase